LFSSWLMFDSRIVDYNGDSIDELALLGEIYRRGGNIALAPP
jgi:hypothetical protein